MLIQLSEPMQINTVKNVGDNYVNLMAVISSLQYRWGFKISVSLTMGY